VIVSILLWLYYYLLMHVLVLITIAAIMIFGNYSNCGTEMTIMTRTNIARHVLSVVLLFCIQRTCVYTSTVHSAVLLNVSWAIDYVGGTCQCNETSISGYGEKCSRAIRDMNIRVCISWHIYQAICRHKKRFHTDELRLRNCKRFLVAIRWETSIEYKNTLS